MYRLVVDDEFFGIQQAPKESLGRRGWIAF
jgi:hypothetical protein